MSSAETEKPSWRVSHQGLLCTYITGNIPGSFSRLDRNGICPEVIALFLLFLHCKPVQFLKDKQAFPSDPNNTPSCTASAHGWTPSPQEPPTSLTFCWFCWASKIPGVSGIMWMLVLSFSQADVYAR